MRRKLFFWLEKLKITPRERIAVASLLVLLLILHVLNLLLDPFFARRRPGYASVEEEFKRRSAIVESRENELLRRYHPEADTASHTIAAREEILPTPVNINTASSDELETLPGVGPVYAGRIIAYRNENGSFKSVDELINIRGIGPQRLENLRALIEI